MRWLKRIIAAVAILFLWFALTLALVSKERLCNAVIEKAAKENVTLCYERRSASLFGCDIASMTLLFAHSPIAKIGKFSATPWKIAAEGIQLEGMAASALPPRIANITILPLKGQIRAMGDFGSIDGTFSLTERTIRLYLTPSSLMRREYRSTLQMFKRKNGKFVYETAF